jgi:hypothetical protein
VSVIDAVTPIPELLVLIHDTVLVARVFIALEYSNVLAEAVAPNTPAAPATLIVMESP